MDGQTAPDGRSGVAGMLDYPVREMIASGSSQPHAPDDPNHTPAGTDPGFLPHKPLKAKDRGGTPAAVANKSDGRCSTRFGYEIEATPHELDKKLLAVGASRLFAATLRATRPFVRTSHAPLRPDPVCRERAGRTSRRRAELK
jgi:hypothetical protein